MGVLFFLCFITSFSPPHGDLHERIVELSSSISQRPDSTQLYLERGELYVLHEDFNAARNDFLFCLHHSLLNSRVYLGMSKTLFALGLPDSSLYYVNQALDLEKIQSAALEWKGFVLQGMGYSCESARTYKSILNSADQPSPSLFIDASRAQMNCPEPGADETTIQILLDGISRLGRLHVLEKELVEVYLHFNRLQDALILQTEMIDQWSVKTKPYYDRAQIFMQMGDLVSAKADLESALQLLDSLPSYKSNTQATQDLRKKILFSLEKMGK